MSELRFEWNYQKELTNIKKHHISFKEAETVFFDETAILFDDPDHSETEERFLLLGASKNSKILIVCHCIRRENVIRIISARKATKTEEIYYQENAGW